MKKILNQAQYQIQVGGTASEGEVELSMAATGETPVSERMKQEKIK